MGKRWTKEEDELLGKIHKGKTYSEITDYFPNRTRISVESRCQLLGYNKNVKNESLTWTKDEIELLVKLYPISTSEELVEIFPNKTKGSISTRALRLNLSKNKDVYNRIKKSNSHKASLFWNEDKNKKLVKSFLDGDNVYEVFQEHDQRFINEKLIENELMNKTEIQIVQDIIGEKQYDSLDLNDILKIYKCILNNQLSGFSFCQTTNKQLIFCFKYFLNKNKINISKETILSTTIGNLLEKAKLKSRVRMHFNGYFDFISSCFPKFKFKEWEFENLNVSDGFWMNKLNCFHVINVQLNKLIELNIIKNKVEILDIPIHQMRELLHNTLIAYYSYSIIFEYFNFHKIDYSNYSDRIYDNQLFDSKEELLVYKILKHHFPEIRKGIKSKDKVTNEFEKESYIPDFIINDRVFIEYYGLFKENQNGFYNDYISKTHRKNKFYDSYCDYFLGIYPNDLSNDLEGLNKKIKEFKSLLKGGELIENIALPINYR